MILEETEFSKAKLPFDPFLNSVFQVTAIMYYFQMLLYFDKNSSGPVYILEISGGGENPI